MTQSCSPKLNQNRRAVASESAFITSEARLEVVERTPFQVSLPIGVNSEAPLAIATPQSVHLDLEDIACFEVVHQQFQERGVTFTNAIALHPSNPAFPPRSGRTLLMGAPKPGLIEATFRRPIAFVSGFVTSSRRTVLSAYDANDRLLAETELSQGNLAGSHSTIPANTELRLTIPNIHRIVFYAFGGHLTIDDFSFGS